ncbi:MAG: hypothetical protein ABI955_08455, partial [Nitrospirota bacterium]
KTSRTPRGRRPIVGQGTSLFSNATCPNTWQWERTKETLTFSNTPSLPLTKKKPTCMGEIAAIVEVLERKGLCTKQDL